MQSTPIGRRQLLRGAVALLGGGAAYHALAAAPAQTTASCVPAHDPNESLRHSLNFTESSPNPEQSCSGCSFFSDPSGSCGQCMIFNGPTNVNGHCDSWAAKA